LSVNSMKLLPINHRTITYYICPVESIFGARVRITNVHSSAILGGAARKVHCPYSKLRTRLYVNDCAR
jgi:hypothetical protein